MTNEYDANRALAARRHPAYQPDPADTLDFREYDWRSHLTQLERDQQDGFPRDPK